MRLHRQRRPDDLEAEARADLVPAAADRDPACRRVLEGLDERRATNMRRFAVELRSTGELRPELDAEQVAHLLWTTNSTALYRLATSGGRGPGDYAALVLDVWTRTLLA